jgi:hypothetical protein
VPEKLTIVSLFRVSLQNLAPVKPIVWTRASRRSALSAVDSKWSDNCPPSHVLLTPAGRRPALILLPAW